MPGLLKPPNSGLKRSRDDGADSTLKKSRKAPKKSSTGEDLQAQVLLLETQILEGNRHLNNIVTLQDIIKKGDFDHDQALLAAVALCRVFCRLIASERLVSRKTDSEESAQIVQWLKARLRDYVNGIAVWIGSPDATKESTAITLLMRIVKEETSQDPDRAEQAWRSNKGTFYVVIQALLKNNEAEGGRQEFVEKYVEEHDDVRFYTLLLISHFAEHDANWANYIDNAIDMLKGIEGVPESADQLEDWFGRTPEPESHRLLSLSAHRKTAQECWLSIFRSPLTAAHRKQLLGIMTPLILPWFATRMEILTDFLTDSFNAGGAISLLALSGIFQLMTIRNLDYPDFYTKLYSLLDQDILHSTHRSRFFRLLDKFMSSSHLPASMVASFIKRFARLALQAPPGAIVWIVPWTYNMLRAHPSCTFMLHRPYHPAHNIYKSHPNYKEEGMDDPFSMDERDPMATGAIDSSLWELQTLQSHWHPNVATLARILGEQFTKRDYSLEDFLDYSYATLIDAELSKDMKKKPEIEWEIPKRILTAEDANGGKMLNELGNLLEAAM